MKKDKKTIMEVSELDPVNSGGFLDISQRILLCAGRGRPSVEFLIELSDILASFFETDVLELWIKERGNCARWEATTNPRRFYRVENATYEALDARIKQGLTFIEEGDKSIACVPLVADKEPIGLLLFKRNQPGSFSSDLKQLCHYVSQTGAIAVTYHRVQLEQRERVKELTCLYEIARIASQQQLSVDQILSQIVAFLPPAWQYPEVTIGRIVLADSVYATEENAVARHLQKADVVIDGVKRGFVEVVYKEDKPELDEGPFLLEERRLIDTIAREIAAIVERKQAEEDRERLQEQLLHADRLATIGQLAAGVAHELNEPLGSILGFAQLASKHADLPEQVEKDLGKIESATLHAREVIRKLMLFARQAPPSKKKVNLNDLIENGLYFLESRCAKAGIDLNRGLTANLPEITADPSQINQILVNLIVNAIQAMEKGGKLSVDTFCDEKFVCMAVADTGSGMSTEIQKKIFIPFFTTKDVGEGTGLGLPVVHGIVTAHGGDIEIQSQPGKGTRFVVRLPIYSKPESIEEGSDHV
ncbi:MAG: PAS domain-containing sensor histidine kinase [Deltaproteobacteria bacterium]|nr:PAS domain-containing sensor histidine kinase [Deltaproteobacteria bacterium]